VIDAEELVRTYSVAQLAETAEEYFAAVSSWTYHLAKPLGSVSEAPTMLAHFGAMLSALQLEPGLDLLDFGAGSCWTSRMLTQLGCQVVACDVSETALAMGRRLFELQPPFGDGSIRFLPFDGLGIELPDESVDRISCMDAFHHVPNWPEVLAEFHRVLRPGGRAVLAEGGPHHSRTQQAQEEMRNFTVVERDMVVEDFAALATAVGFGPTTVGIYAGIPHLVPAETFSADLASGEVAKAAAISFLDNHRLVVLSKPGQRSLTSRGLDGLGGTIEAEHLGGRRFAVTVTNTGASTWLGSGAPVGAVNLGVQLFDADDRRVDLDYLRLPLHDNPSTETSPGQQIRIEFELPAPEITPFRLTFDLVSEGVAWFRVVGASPMVQSSVLH
jgi:ubiquinone/menaquinone biosynthesis C-methylase UbiE